MSHQVVNLNLVEVVAVGFEVGGLCILRGLRAVGKRELENALDFVREREGVALDEPVDPDSGERLVQLAIRNRLVGLVVSCVGSDQL
jgi:hypothetical protein